MVNFFNSLRPNGTHVEANPQHSQQHLTNLPMYNECIQCIRPPQNKLIAHLSHTLRAHCKSAKGPLTNELMTFFSNELGERKALMEQFIECPSKNWKFAQSQVDELPVHASLISNNISEKFPLNQLYENNISCKSTFFALIYSDMQMFLTL